MGKIISLTRNGSNPDYGSMLEIFTNQIYTPFKDVAGWTTQSGWHDCRKLPELIFDFGSLGEFKINNTIENGWYYNGNNGSLIGAYLIKISDGTGWALGIIKNGGVNDGWTMTSVHQDKIVISTSPIDQNPTVIEQGFNYPCPKVISKPFAYNGKKIKQITDTGKTLTLELPINIYTLENLISSDRTWTGMNGKTFSMHMLQSVGDQNHGGIRNGFNYGNNNNFTRSLDCPKNLVDFYGIKYREWTHRFAYHNGWATGYMNDSRTINLTDLKDFVKQDGEYAVVKIKMTSSHVDHSFDFGTDWYSLFEMVLNLRYYNNRWEWRRISVTSKIQNVAFATTDTRGWPGENWEPMITRVSTENFNNNNFFGGVHDTGGIPVHQLGMYLYINQGWLTFGYGFNYAEGSGVGMFGVVLTDLVTRTVKQ